MRLLKIQSKDYLLDKLMSEIVKDELQKVSKPFAWLAYAQKSDFGYSINFGSSDLDTRLIVLNKIAKATKKRMRNNFTLSQIVDRLSFLVNTSVKDEMGIRKIKLPGNISSKEKEYVTKSLIRAHYDGLYVSQIPWLMLTTPIKNGYKGQNILTNSDSEVIVTVTKQYTYFDITK